jgi:segregation and condensation protein A
MAVYAVHLKAFEGPLDLLLHLIQRAQVDIRDIFVSEITEQYLASMATIEEVEELDMDTASEFLEVAATLLEIKSRALLPKPPEPEAGEETPEESLISRLTAYRALREGMGRMRDLETAAAELYSKLPEEIPLPPPTFEITNLTMDGLLSALGRVLARLRIPEPTLPRDIVRRDLETVEQGMFRIAARLREGPCVFESLFGGLPTRGEVVALFLALLEMMRLRRVTLRQAGTFAPIWLEAAAASAEFVNPMGVDLANA